tara:strand:- start:50 stop:424 length:375 start_codon:yes stop_codon:yes gene_type:complete
MTTTIGIICCGIILTLSIGANIILVWYMKQIVSRFFVASEEASEIFSKLDAFSEHLQSVYDMPTFYGDETLQSLLKHNKEIIEFLKKYEMVYSFTQPDLVEQLQAASEDLEHYDKEETSQTQDQ